MRWLGGILLAYLLALGTQAQAACTSPFVDIGGGQCRAFIVGGSSFALPTDWTDTNTIEAIGAGGGSSAGTPGGAFIPSGGGGGAYSGSTNVTGLSGTVTIQVGSGGGNATAGGDTWFNGASCAGASVCAKGGNGASGATGGSGGASSGGVGDTKYLGGSGDLSNFFLEGGGGGGGAAGPSGAGALGGAGGYGTAGASGGGANGGSPGAATNIPSGGLDGATGGNGPSASGGGVGSAAGSPSAQGGDGTVGGGGGGSGSITTDPGTSGRGGLGGSGTEWDSTHGAGGGGGGAGGRNFAPHDSSTSGNGGGGGSYGGGGGAPGYVYPGGTSGAAGAGGNGLVVLTYTPVSSACGFGSATGNPNECRGFITTTGAGTFSVPSDWSSTNTIEALGGGGGGAGGISGGDTTAGRGGGGGEYRKIINLTLTPSVAVDVSVGVGGTGGPADGNGTAGGNTFLKNNSGTIVIQANGGGPGLAGTDPPGAGGSGGIGAAAHANGGIGGLENQSRGGSGGGGAGGPLGAGAGGGGYTGVSNAMGGAGGGSADGGSAGVDAQQESGVNGGANDGGTNAGGVGAAVSPTPSPGGTPSVTAGHGGPGAGGGAGTQSAGNISGAGGVGGAGKDWDASHGSGGGGGGGGGDGFNTPTVASIGGAGGLYGGGGGGGGWATNLGGGGAGGKGLLAITYTQATAPPTAAGGTLLTMMGVGGSRGAPTGPIPVAINCSVSNPADNASAGTSVCSIIVTTSNGSTFAGSTSLTDLHSPQLFALSGPTIAPNLVTSSAWPRTSADDGLHNVTVFAQQNGTQIQQTIGITIQPSGGSIACGIGPNYTGVIPAGATAAGFTTCAANYDFTNAVYSNTATWVDCAGAASPQLRKNGNFPCSAIRIASDGGVPQVLDLLWDPSYTANAPGNQTFFTTQYPEGVYVDLVYRWSSGMLTACSVECLIGGLYTESINCCSVPAYEWDFNEQFLKPGFSQGYTATHSVPWAGLGPLFGVGTNYYQLAGSDPTQYHEYGSRITTDGNTNFAMCNYFNGTFISCGSGTTTIPIAPADQPNNYQLEIGPLGTLVWNNAADFFIQRITIFSCSAWNTTKQCNNSPVLTSAP